MIPKTSTNHRTFSLKGELFVRFPDGGVNAPEITVTGTTDSSSLVDVLSASLQTMEKEQGFRIIGINLMATFLEDLKATESAPVHAP